MSKRAREKTDEVKWLRKMKKYERKLEEERRKPKKRRMIIYSDDEDGEQPEAHQQRNTYMDGSAASETTPKTTADNTAEAPAENTTEAPVEADSDNIDMDYDPELIQALGDVEVDVVEYGDDLQGDLATRLQKILVSGLKKESKEELLKKYLYPKNVPFAKGPTLNPEIGAMLVETCKLRDKRLLAKQDQLGKALSALGVAMTALMKKNSNIQEVIRTLNDAIQLLADSHYAETDTRRSVIIPLIDKSLSDPFKDRKRDNLLFGENLGEAVKNSRGIKKTSQLIQAPATNLNWKGPSTSRARQQRGGHSYPSRAGAPRPAPYPHGRRAPPPPPPAPPVRRAPPPPPAAPARRAYTQAQRPQTSR